MLRTLLVTKSLKPALLKTVTTQVSTHQTVSFKPTLNHPNPLALSPLNRTVFAFPLPPTVKPSLVPPYFLANLLRLLRLLLVYPRRRLLPRGPRDKLEPRLVLLDLLKLLLLMQLPLPFLVSRPLSVSPLLPFFSYKRRFLKPDSRFKITMYSTLLVLFHWLLHTVGQL